MLDDEIRYIVFKAMEVAAKTMNWREGETRSGFLVCPNCRTPRATWKVLETGIIRARCPRGCWYTEFTEKDAAPSE